MGKLIEEGDNAIGDWGPRVPNGDCRRMPRFVDCGSCGSDGDDGTLLPKGFIRDSGFEFEGIGEFGADWTTLVVGGNESGEGPCDGRGLPRMMPNVSGEWGRWVLSIVLLLLLFTGPPSSWLVKKLSNLIDKHSLREGKDLENLPTRFI